ncbi:hypothetical protein ACTFIW_002488 [Dictyostelium discoideum]
MNSAVNLRNSNSGININELKKLNLNSSSNSINSGSSNGSNNQQQQIGYTIDNVVTRGNEFKYTFSLPSREQILNLKQGDLVKLIFSEGNQAERMFVEIIDLCLYDSNNDIASSNSCGQSLKQGIEIFHGSSNNNNNNNNGDEENENGSSSSSSSKNIHKDEKNKLVNSQSNNGSSGSASGGGGRGLRSPNSSSNNNNNNMDEFSYNSIKFTGLLDNNPYQLKSLKLGDRIEFFDYNILSIYNQPNQLYHPDLDCVPGSIKQLFDQLCLVSNRILVDKEHIGYIFRENGTFPNDSGWRIFAGDEADDYMNKKENYQLVSLASVLNIDDSILLLLGSSIDHHFEFDDESNQWKELVEK